VFLITFIYMAISALLHSATFVQAIFGGLLSVCLYGKMFWGGFIVALVVLDLLLIIHNQNNLKVKLIIEWFIINIPLIYWTIKYSEWILLVAVIAFLITQLLREKRIIASTL
jgi:hypothetical protein